MTCSKRKDETCNERKDEEEEHPSPTSASVCLGSPVW